MIKHVVITVVFDVAVGVILLGLWFVVTTRFQPTTLGFMCDDTSIVYPYTTNTVSSGVLYGVGLALPIAAFIIIECALSKWLRNEAFDTRGWSKTPPCCIHLYHLLVTFLNGFVATMLITEIGKDEIGRLRPHFLAVCQPTGYSCSSSGFASARYVAAGAYSCNATGYTNADVLQARMSFPSGHASTSFYTMVFLALYLQARIVWREYRMLRSLLQIVAISLAWMCALSRVMDYWHHWSDVLAGALLGAALACYYMCGVLRLLRLPGLFEIEKLFKSKQANAPEATSSESNSRL